MIFQIKNEENTFTEYLNKNWKDDNVFPPGIDAQVAINFLANYLLGNDFYTICPSNEQANTEIVDKILSKYSNEYRKEKRKKK
jgi:hypothetical protein